MLQEKEKKMEDWFETDKSCMQESLCLPLQHQMKERNLNALTNKGVVEYMSQSICLNLNLNYQHY